MVGICINPSHMRNWFAGDFTAVTPLIRLTDELALTRIPRRSASVPLFRYLTIPAI
ncbi:MAG: hypothetical protein JWM91_1221 [Rhodospirillales bacterium]|nr:hypothetical protein [Rhodospirillales bacterium]